MAVHLCLGITYYIYYQMLYICPYARWFGESVNKFGISPGISPSLDLRALLFTVRGKMGVAACRRHTDVKVPLSFPQRNFLDSSVMLKQRNSSPILPPDFDCIRVVHSFDELASTPFGDGVNALCWPRVLDGDFAEVVEKIGSGDGITILDERMLQCLHLSEAGRLAVGKMLEDERLLSDLGLDPVLNCIHGYPRDDDGPLSTDVFSFHADSAPVQAETWLCTYIGASSEGVRNEEAVRHVDVPATRTKLLDTYGGHDDEGFQEFLSENCYHLHYKALPDSNPYTFGVGNLWRIAVEHPGSPVPPCIHRAPCTDAPRLLLIS